MLALLVESALRSLALGATVWLALALLRVRNPHVHMTAWTVVLIASLSMPVLMRWVPVTIPAAPPQAQTVKVIWAAPAAPLDTMVPAPEPLQEPVASPPSPPPDATLRVGDTVVDAIDWRVLATGLYVVVAGVFLLRLLTGILLTWRLARAARPIRERWAAGLDVRVSDHVGVPVTFGATILLPPEYRAWSLAKRRAVLSHEGAHVAHGDFHVLVLAALNRAVFWFNPFAWWQLARLAELAEIISDDAAIEMLADRASYADILLDVARRVQRAPAGLAMARPCTVRQRVERILAVSAVSARMDWRRKTMVAVALVPLVALSAASIAQTTSPTPARSVAVAPIAPSTEPELVAPEQTTSVTQHKRVAVEARLLDSYVGFYAMDATVRPHVMLAVTREGDQLLAQLTGQQTFPLFAESDREFFNDTVAALITFIAEGTGRPAELILNQNGRDWRAARLADLPPSDHRGVAVDAKVLDALAGWYELAPTRALTVTRKDDHLLVQETGRPKFEVFAHGIQTYFSADGSTLVVFKSDGEGRPAELVLLEPSPGARRATRVDDARARAIEDVFARRIALAPDHFRDQAPAPGTKAAVLRGIADLQRGTPNYERMSLQLADSVRRRLPQFRDMLTALGTAESIFFRGVGPGGYDIYGVKFAHGSAEFRILLGDDGKTEDVIFRPAGDDTPGEVVACSQEPTLKAVRGTAPIRLVLYNASGADIRLFGLNFEGQRMPQTTIGDNRSAPVMTYVGRPWVIADASGQCLEIVVPGYQTRFLMLRHTEAGALQARPASRRTTPKPGSDEALRRYIEAVGRGEPNYHQMTPEVAAQTREQLLLDQAILAKLGELRAMSFRGVTLLDNDIYMAHFANGSAEWRIGLVQDGRIGRILLGPQY